MSQNEPDRAVEKKMAMHSFLISTVGYISLRKKNVSENTVWSWSKRQWQQLMTSVRRDILSRVLRSRERITTTGNNLM